MAIHSNALDLRCVHPGLIIGQLTIFRHIDCRTYVDTLTRDVIDSAFAVVCTSHQLEHTFKASTLASLKFSDPRITSRTTSKLQGCFHHSKNIGTPIPGHPCARRAPSFEFSIWSRCLTQDPNVNDRKRIRPKAEDLIRDLLSPTFRTSTEEVIRLDEPRAAKATFTPKFRNYGYHESPSTRWNQRKEQRKDLVKKSSRLGGNETRGFSVDRQAHRGTIGELVLTAKHREYLEAPRHELFSSERKFDWIPTKRMRSWVQVITTPTADTPGTTLLLHFDNKRYVIGSLAEGTQRAMVQMGARMLKVSECFITGRTEWKNTGGLIGMILTLADANANAQAANREEVKKRARTKAKKINALEDEEKIKQLEDEALKELSSSNGLTLFSPPNLNHTLATARRFVFRKGMPVDVHEISEALEPKEGEEECAPYWADENIKVWAISVLPKCTSNIAITEASRQGTVSPRKRSIGEVYGHEPISDGGKTGNSISPTITNELTMKERDTLAVKAVVGEMFDSSWRLDTLYETPISEVRLPATVFVRNAETHKIERYTGLFPGGKEGRDVDPHLKVLVRRPWPGALVESLPPTEPAKEAVSYIIRNHRQRGKFRPDQAMKHKVPKGLLWSQLTAGHSVTNADGDTITPEMVLGESKEGGGMVVLDIPEPSYIEPLLARPEWRESKIMAGVGAVVWICGRDVADDARLHAFMREFSHLHHVLSAPDQCPNNVALDSVATSTIRLRQVDPKRYVVPIHDNDSPSKSENLPPEVHLASRGMMIRLEPNIEVQRSQVVQTLDVAAVEAETAQDVLEEARMAQRAAESDAEEKQRWASTLPPRAKDVEVVTLGTGSALPSKYRNVSASLMCVPGWGNVLFDAGENTLGQLKRVFAADELMQIFRDLRVLSISHMHADHHLGAVGILRAWYEIVHGAQPLPHSTDLRTTYAENGGLAVIAEPAMQHWLHEYAAVEDYGYSRIAPVSVQVRGTYPAKMSWFMSHHELADLTPSETTDKYEAAAIPPSFLNLVDFQACNVQHCHGARAVSLTFPSGFKASYSGDCRPSRAFERIGSGSTLVIHEATFDDELLGDAMAKNHSTTSEALTVAQNMGAKACILTHFSQRYQKLPILENTAATEEIKTSAVNDTVMGEEAQDDSEPEDLSPLQGENEQAVTYADQGGASSTAQNIELPRHSVTSATSDEPTAPSATRFKLTRDMKVCVAFDYMRVKLGELPEMEKFTPALLKLFAEEDKPEVAEELENGKSKGKQVKKQKPERRN
nr:ribonuclease z [Quercus suber]